MMVNLRCGPTTLSSVQRGSTLSSRLEDKAEGSSGLKGRAGAEMEDTSEKVGLTMGTAELGAERELVLASSMGSEAGRRCFLRRGGASSRVADGWLLLLLEAW